MIDREGNTRRVTLRAVRAMVAMRLIGRAIASPDGERGKAAEDSPPQMTQRNGPLRPGNGDMAPGNVAKRHGCPPRPDAQPSPVPAPEPVKIPRNIVEERLPAPSLGNDRLGKFDRVRAPADVGRYRRALERAAAEARAERNRPVGDLPMAASREGCPHCGIPGFRGCEHQSPYVEPDKGDQGYDYTRAGK